jgi:hypothetical protein
MVQLPAYEQHVDVVGAQILVDLEAADALRGGFMG